MNTMALRILTEQDVLSAIQDGNDALSLLEATDPKFKKRWKRLCVNMNRYLEDVQSFFPDAQYYTGGGGFNLLLGRSHNDACRPQDELVALEGIGVEISDGDW